MNTRYIIASATVAVCAYAGIAFAQSANVTNSIKATVSASTNTKLTKVISQGDGNISVRLTALANLNTRIQELKKLSAPQKTTLTTQIQNNIAGLTALKAKLDADTDVTTASNDAKSALTSFRIYALVIPQGYISASSDRINAVASMLTTISGKLQTRITAEQNKGRNVASLQASLANMNSNLVDATNQASQAINSIQYLTPDQGDQSARTSNTTALKAARVQIQAGTQDLKVARADAKSIIAGLKAFESASVSATTTAAASVRQ